MNITLIWHKNTYGIWDPICYPLGFMYVSAWLKQRGHTVKVLNFNLRDYDLSTELKGQDLALFSIAERERSSFLPRIIEQTKICRELGVGTILGGAWAMFHHQEMEKYFDQVFVGEIEGEMSIDEIPWPDYEGFGIDEYHRIHRIRYMGILTSRGCPGSCTFCSHTCPFRMRELSNVFDEIDFYQEKYAVDVICFNDNTLNIDKTRFMLICAGMLERGLAWGAAIRCDVFDEDMAKAAKGSDCLYLTAGVDSFKQDKLDRMKKQTKVEDNYRTLDLLNQHGIQYGANVLVGFKDETYHDILREISQIPPGSCVYPRLVETGPGTQHGSTRLLTDEEYAFLSALIKARRPATNPQMDAVMNYRRQNGKTVHTRPGSDFSRGETAEAFTLKDSYGNNS